MRLWFRVCSVIALALVFVSWFTSDYSKATFYLLFSWYMESIANNDDYAL